MDPAILRSTIILAIGAGASAWSVIAAVDAKAEVRRAERDLTTCRELAQKIVLLSDGAASATRERELPAAEVSRALNAALEDVQIDPDSLAQLRAADVPADRGGPASGRVQRSWRFVLDEITVAQAARFASALRPGSSELTVTAIRLTPVHSSSSDESWRADVTASYFTYTAPATPSVASTAEER